MIIIAGQGSADLGIAEMKGIFAVLSPKSSSISNSVIVAFEAMKAEFSVKGLTERCNGRFGKTPYISLFSSEVTTVVPRGFLIIIAYLSTFVKWKVISGIDLKYLMW